MSKIKTFVVTTLITYATCLNAGDNQDQIDLINRRVSNIARTGDERFEQMDNRLQNIERRLSEVENRVCVNIPEIARGHEDIYKRFINGSVIYKNDDGEEISIPIKDWIDLNTLEGTVRLDKYGCTEAEKRLTISFGYHRRNDYTGKIEIWIVPRFVISRSASGEISHLQDAIHTSNWPISKDSIGVFSRWGNWENLQWFDFIHEGINKLSGKNLHKLDEDSTMYCRFSRAISVLGRLGKTGSFMHESDQEWKKYAKKITFHFPELGQLE